MLNGNKSILSLRARALSKLSQVYIDSNEKSKGSDLNNSTSKSRDDTDALDVITRSLPVFYSTNASRIYTMPLTLNEWEILLAVSSTVPKSLEKASRLLNDVISCYFLESPRQRVSDVLLAKFRLNDIKNPNEVLTYQLTKYLITISTRFPEVINSCLSLIDQYLSLINKLFNDKQSSLFSLLGFMNAFINDNSSLELSTFVWRKISQIFMQGGFLNKIDTILTSAPSFTNDSIVQYFDSGNEISGPLFINLLSELQVSLACRMLDINHQPNSLTNYLLDQQANYFKNEEFISDSASVKQSNLSPFVLDSIEPHIALIEEICEFTLKYSTSMDDIGFDLSSDTRSNFSFRTTAHFIQFLCLTPYLTSSNKRLFHEFTKFVGLSLNKYFLPEIITPYLVKSIVTAGALLNFFTEDVSESLLRSFPILVGSEQLCSKDVSEISEIFAIALQPLNEDSIVSTIYSINNLLTVDDNMNNNFLRERQLTLTTVNSYNYDELPKSDSFDALRLLKYHNNSGTHTNGQLSNKKLDLAYRQVLYENCVTATRTIAAHYNNQTITALTISILTQKVGVISDDLDEIILKALAELAPRSSTNQFSMLQRFFRLTDAFAIKNNNAKLSSSITNAKSTISQNLFTHSDLNCEIYKMHLTDLLDTIISSGEVDKPEHHRPHTEISRVADQIANYLTPLAMLLPNPGSTPIDLNGDENLTIMFRNMWFNMVVHGFYWGSEIVKRNYKSLLTIAYNSAPLASDFPANNKEMSLEMNTILRRGSSNSNIKQQKQLISEYLNTNAVQSRTLSSSKIMFIASTVLLETIRCEAGDCSKVILYFSDPSIESSSIDKSILTIANAMIKKYVNLVEVGHLDIFNSKAIANQLNNILLCLADRNELLQDAAFQCCDLFIRSIPSSLCHHNSLFTLLDLMTAIFDSVVDCQTNRFQVHYEFVLKHSQKKVLVPGSKAWRTSTMSRLYKTGKGWLKIVLNRSNQDTKILLQSYVSDISQIRATNVVEYGVSFAIEMAGLIIPVDKELSRITYRGSDKPNTISSFISQHLWRSKFLVDTAIVSSKEDISDDLCNKVKCIREKLDLDQKISQKEITDFLDMSAALLILGNIKASSLIFDMVHLPFEIFTSSALQIATNVWLTIIKERSDLAHILLAEVCYCWMNSIDKNIGLFSQKHDLISVENQMMEYAPYDKATINKDSRDASQSMKPHRHIIRFFVSHFEGTRFESESLLKIFTRSTLFALSRLKGASYHPFARMIRNELLVFGTIILKANSKQHSIYVERLCQTIIDGGLSWFVSPIAWPFGSNELKINADLSIMLDLYSKLDDLREVMNNVSPKEFDLLRYFLANEIQNVETWLSPLTKISGANSNELPENLVDFAYHKDPRLAVNIVNRYPGIKYTRTLESLVNNEPLNCVGVPDALDSFLSVSSSNKDRHAILYWVPVNPLKSINLFSTEWNQNEFILQYSIFSLESHDVNVTFFYVPQIVQCLRFDRTGYVERLILETAKISMLFSHQIIWNMLANCYKGDEGEIEDEIKPTLDRVRKRMLKTFSKKHYEFYQTEFGFFNEITSISGKLRPYIKKSKAEKKQKIDDEMKKIVVKPGVYLPSNPDGTVIDINRTSGKPLQSHAKAPFMATFKIKKDVKDADTGEVSSIEKWQAAIFKVGDDCRQDVLALQLISMFRSIWSTIGLDVYVFPYRVTATDPGCGVIDVLPNSISRDMLGREAVNGLYEYFISKFGSENTIEYQNARNNFVKSLAGYSVISYLLQFKDRHNGNIMYDDQGHCLHIDFGFIFDIVPGGVKFEAVPFKLTKEMVKVMGGSSDTPAYRDFEEICIKAYLAARPHMDAIMECIEPMLSSGLPCFKGSKTMTNLEARFQPNKTDHEAAAYMKGLIKKSFESVFTKGYDEFQRLTNGIPY